MCGIVGYLGFRKAYPIVINGLQRLEYRGYDSAGIVLINESNVNLYKTKGKVSDLKKLVEKNNSNGGLALGHTRWGNSWNSK